MQLPLIGKHNAPASAPDYIFCHPYKHTHIERNNTGDFAITCRFAYGDDFRIDFPYLGDLEK